jgi:hypothetical protein
MRTESQATIEHLDEKLMQYFRFRFKVALRVVFRFFVDCSVIAVGNKQTAKGNRTSKRDIVKKKMVERIVQKTIMKLLCCFFLKKKKSYIRITDNKQNYPQSLPIKN